MFNVGTLEEDFKKIGILPQDQVVTPAEAPKTVVSESVEQAEAPSDSSLTERLRLLRKQRVTGATRSLKRKQKLLRRRKKTKLNRKSKQWRKSSKGKRFAQKYKRALDRMHGHAPANKRISLRMGADTVSDMVEQTGYETVIESYTNLALVADDLTENFALACESLEVVDESGAELDLCGCAKKYAKLSEAAMAAAEKQNAFLQEGKEFSTLSESGVSEFNAMLDDVLEGLEILSDLSGEDEDTSRPT